jgi:hypothetical protein
VNTWSLLLAISVLDDPKALLKSSSESSWGIGSAFIVIFNNLLLQNKIAGSSVLLLDQCACSLTLINNVNANHLTPCTN